MKTINRLVILAIVLNFLILIALGHGGVILGLLAFWESTMLLQGDLDFNDQDEVKLFTASYFSLLGQIILLIAYFRKAEMQKYKFIYLGLPLLFFSFIILNADLMVRNDTQISFWSGMPFVISAILLLILTIKRHKKANQETQRLL
jgi:hypothetical protein